MINDKKGQALVEFVLILPIFLIMLFLIIDFGRIFYSKIKMEGIINEVVKYYQDGKDYNELKKYINKQDDDILLDIDNDEEYKTIVLTTKLSLSTPLLNKFMDNPYKVFVERVVYNE